MTDAELETRFPSIPWREPFPVRRLGTDERGLGCRLCIAKHGIKSEQIKDLPQTRADFEKHMKEVHP